MEDLKILGNNLSLFRKKNNLSYQAVAEILGISAAHVCRIENCSAKPSFDVVLNISHMMNIPLYYLFLNFDETIDLSDFLKSVQLRLEELQWSPDRLAKETHINLFRILDFLNNKSLSTKKEIYVIAKTLQLPEPELPINQRFILLERLLCDLGLDQDQIRNITEYIYSIQK